MTIYLIFALICSTTYEISAKKFETKKNDAKITYPDKATRSILRVTRESSPSEILKKKNELEGLPRVQFRNIQSDKCLYFKSIKSKPHDTHTKNQIGTVYKISTCNNKDENQWFGFQYPNYKRLDGNFDGYMNIVGHRSKCLSSIYHNGKLTQEYCGDSDNLLWRTEKYEKGSIIVSKTGTVMDAQNGNEIMGMKRTNGPHQIWAITDVQTKEERKVQLKKEQANWPLILCSINLYSKHMHHKMEIPNFKFPDKKDFIFCVIQKGAQHKTCSFENPIKKEFQDSPKFFENVSRPSIHETSKCICEVSLHQGQKKQADAPEEPAKIEIDKPNVLGKDWWVDYSINGTRELYPNEKTLKYHKKADRSKIYCRRAVMDGYNLNN